MSDRFDKVMAQHISRVLEADNENPDTRQYLNRKRLVKEQLFELGVQKSEAKKWQIFQRALSWSDSSQDVA